MRRMGWIFFLCIALFGCTRTVNEQINRYHDDGRAKPTIALLPVFHQGEANVSWSLSEEFTHHLRQQFLKKSSVCLTATNQIDTISPKLTEKPDPFSTDYDWVKTTFEGVEFIVFTELVEHNIHPKTLKNNFLDKLTPSCELSMTMRIRVFDLRGAKPQVILQELVRQSHLIPKPSHLMEKASDHWKKVIFNISPMGFAHAQLSREVGKRIEAYIVLAKSH